MTVALSKSKTIVVDELSSFGRRLVERLAVFGQDIAYQLHEMEFEPGVKS